MIYQKEGAGKIGMPEELRELSSIGVIINWNDVDRNEPLKPTKQLMLADFFEVTT